MGKFAIPGAIIVAGLLIAGAVFLSTNRGNTPQNPSQNEGNPEAALPVTEDDFILGSRNAKITIIEYSDIDCPFCKQFHETMKRIIDEYGPSGDVAWVYRHLPLTVLHPNAERHAEAAECVGRIGGNTAFWDFLDVLFENAPGNAQTDPSRYAEFAAQVGVSEADLTACIAQGDAMAHVTAETNTAIEAGATGTPFNVIVVEGQDPVAVSGALPYDQMRGVIEQVLTGQ